MYFFYSSSGNIPSKKTGFSTALGLKALSVTEEKGKSETTSMSSNSIKEEMMKSISDERVSIMIMSLSLSVILNLKFNS